MRRGTRDPAPEASTLALAAKQVPLASRVCCRADKQLLLSISVVEDMWESYCPPDIERV